MLFTPKRFIPLVAVILCTVLTMLIPAEAATPIAVPNFGTLTSSQDNKKLSDYFTAEYTRTVSNDNNTVTASGNKITMTAMGHNGGSGCNYEPVSTIVRFTATQNVTVTCTLENSAKIHAPDTAQVSGTQYTVTVKKGSVVSFEVYSGNKTQNTGSVTFNALNTPGTEVTVPADCASFSYNGTFYPYLDQAIKAVGTNSGIIILEKDGKVYPSPSNGGNTIAIPSNVKLLIPYCGGDTAGNFGAPSTAKITGSDRTAYRTMTLGEGIIINCAGQICVNAQQRTDVHNTGYVAGQYGHIVLEKNSAINLTGSGKLFAYGYISGEGKVTAASGTEVRELIHLPGWRGGSVSSDLNSKHSNGNFNSLLFTTYYIQNILCNLEISGGAACLVHGSIMPNSTPKGFVAPLLAPEGYQLDGKDAYPQFGLSSDGLMTRKYDASTDRMIYTLTSGKATTFGMSMSMDGIAIDTSKFIFPLDSSMTFCIQDDAEFEISKQIKLVPESQLIIEEGGTCTVSGSLYVYDKDQWGTFTVLANGSSDTYYQYAPSKLPTQFRKVSDRTTVNSDAKLQVDGTLHVTSTTGNVYTSESGGIVCGTGTIEFDASVSTANFIVHECKSRSKPSYSYVGDVQAVTFKPLRANLAGKSGLNSMSANEIYTGVLVDSIDYWHEAELMQKVDATCTAEGSITYNVTGGSGLTVKTDKLPHTEVTDAAVAATCTEPGKTEGKHCSVCGTVTVTQQTVDALGHKEVIDAAVAATCTTAGKTEGKHCSVCGTVTVAQTTVAAKGHTEVVDAAVAATCTETGLTEGKHCSVCSTVIVAQEEVAALGHSYESEVTEPTCTVAGFTKHTCTVCGDTYSDTETQPTGIHTDADGKEDAGFLLCDGCNAPVARLASLEASADAATELRMKFYIHPSLTTAEDGSKLDMKALVQFAGVKATEETVSLSNMETDKSGRYVFVCNVNSGEMRRNMTVSFTDANDNSVIIIDGQTSADAVSRSVADYAELVLANGSDKQKNVIKALLTYGGYAQIYFNVDADNPVYNLLGETPNLDAVAIPTLESLDTKFGDIQFTQAEVFLQSAIKMQYTYTATTPDDDSFLLTYAYKNQPYTKAITPTSNTVNENTVYYLVVEEIPAAYFGHKYAIDITEGENTGTIAMSVYDYLYLLLNPKNPEKPAPSLEMINLAKAMYLYGEAANAFFFPVESAQ